MQGMTPRRIADACGGILHVPDGPAYPADEEISSIVTDSRKAGPGSVFAAIVGERVDGHSFIPQVFSQGAACVITEKELPDAAGCWIKVNSTLTALKGIAEYYRCYLGIPVVGVTGSVGKTSTKEMIAAVLAQKYCVHKTKGNFNNELGLPLTIFDLTQEHEIAVLEMGISDFGEMHRLAQIARPDTCVITNIGQCHLEFLGDRDGVLRAKTEIFDFLKEDGHIVLNGNDDKLRTVRNVGGILPVFYGIPEKEADLISFFATDIRPLGLRGSSCTIHTPGGSFEVTIPIPGRHMVMNALAAAAVGERYGLSLQQIRSGIEGVERVGGRLNIVETDRYTLIDDCYNANPMSMKASLDVLADAGSAEGARKGRLVAVLGDMFELGPDELAMHAGVGAHAAACGIDLLVTIGERSRSMYEAAAGEGMQGVCHFDTVDQFLEQADSLMAEGDTVLIKASHAMKFEEIVKRLRTENGVQDLQAGPA